MRKSVMLLLLAFVAIHLSAQSFTLKEILQSAESQQGTAKLNTLNKVAGIYLESDLESAKNYAEAALQLAVELNDLAGQADSYNILGMVFTKKFDYERAMEAHVERLKISDGMKDAAAQAESRIKIGEVYFLMEDYLQAEENLQKAISIAKENNFIQVLANANKGLGDVYLAKKIYGKALDHYSLAAEQKRIVGQVGEAASICLHLGNISSDLGNQEGALVYFRNALDLHRETNNQAKIAETNRKISLALLAQDEPIEARAYNETAYKIALSMEDTLGQAECFKNFALIQCAMGEKANAKSSLQKGAALIHRVAVTPKVPTVYENIALTYSKLGDYEKAFENHVAFSNARNEYFNQEKSKALLDLTTKYESEFEAREKQQQIEMLELENLANRKVTYFLYIVVALIGMLLLNLFSSYRRKKKDNQLLQEQNKEIMRQDEEINFKNVELEAKNISLDLLNKKLLSEISEREVIEKSSFARDRFLATMSHEMRTPLNIITGLTHILLKENPRADQKEQLRTLQFSANDLVVFINDVLDFSKIEAGKLNIEDREFSPAKLVDDVQKRFVVRAEENKLGFDFRFDRKIPDTLLGDDARLTQILTNLLTNTFQYTKEGEVTWSISLHELKSREAMLKIMVAGSDGGVNRKDIEEMFNLSYSADEDFEGYDSQHFSLAITKRLVELQNGKFEVDAIPEEGTVFTVLLPFKLVVPQPMIKKRRVSGSLEILDGSKILVVEDNKINQLVVSKILKRMGVHVSLANNGQEALDIIETNDFDLILMDIQMPVMDGYRATAEIRRHHSESKRDIPIIALTASAFLTEKEKAVLFGMNDHVGKPFSPDELMEKIKNCLAVYKTNGEW